MIRNQNHIKEIKKLLGKNKEIYLHGSRRMAEQLNVTSLLPSDTDYDYAVQWWDCGKTLFELVEENGWDVLGDKSYRDVNNTVVAQKMIGLDKVQVQFKKNLALYQAVFESINPSFYFDKFYKKDRDGYKAYLKSSTEAMAELMGIKPDSYPDDNKVLALDTADF